LPHYMHLNGSLHIFPRQLSLFSLPSSDTTQKSGNFHLITRRNVHLHRHRHLAHLQNKHSNSVELYGSASASKSKGISVATTQSAVRPRRLTRCAASTYCLPSHKTESRRSTWCAFSEPFLSSLRQMRTRSRLFMVIFVFNRPHFLT
jgi:hypothetical protein